MNPLQPRYGGGGDDAFVAEILAAQPIVSFAPTSLNFGNQTVGTTSSNAKVTLTNSGQLTLTISAIQITGTNSDGMRRPVSGGMLYAPKLSTCSRHR
jgi:hypothetical protein